MIFKIYSAYFSNSIRVFVFVMLTYYVPCAIGTEILYILLDEFRTSEFEIN
jgi:hypothetical protein